MKVTLIVNGMNMTFCEEELSTIVENQLTEEMSMAEYFCRPKNSTSNMQVVLNVGNFEMGFSEKELICIVNRYFSRDSSIIDNTSIIPAEGKWFHVVPFSIEWRCFRRERKDPRQEETRQLILEALNRLENDPNKYGKRFSTYIPKKTWKKADANYFSKVAETFEGHIANKFQQEMEWAQRITNGESWEKICNEPDECSYYRMIVWDATQSPKCLRIIGGSTAKKDLNAPSFVDKSDQYFFLPYESVVPLIAKYD